MHLKPVEHVEQGINIERKTRRLAYEELETYIQSIVKRFQRQTKRKLKESNKQLGIISASRMRVARAPLDPVRSGTCSTG